MFISQSNIEYLKDLQARIGHIGTIHKVNSNNDQGGYKLYILSTKLREYLCKYEITSDKRHNIVYAKAPNLDLERSFIRGLFDGDGCIYYAYTSGVFTNKNVSITSGSIDLILGVENFCKKYSIECVVRKRVAVNEYYILNIEKFEDIIKFGRTIYNEADFYLKRKYIKFLKFKKLVELDKEVNEIVDGSKKLDVL